LLQKLGSRFRGNERAMFPYKAIMRSGRSRLLHTLIFSSSSTRATAGRFFIRSLNAV